MAGWIELTWQEEPTEQFMKQVSEVICAYCMLNVKMLDGWENIFIRSGASNLQTEIHPMHFSGFLGMIRDEGLTNSIRITKKFLTDSKVRNRMNTMDKFFKKNQNVLGYGIFTMTKHNAS